MSVILSACNIVFLYYEYIKDDHYFKKYFQEEILCFWKIPLYFSEVGWETQEV